MSWFASFLTLISVYLIGKKKPIGQFIGLIGSITWVCIMWNLNFPQVILNFIFIILYLKNYIEWRKN